MGSPFRAGAGVAASCLMDTDGRGMMGDGVTKLGVKASGQPRAQLRSWIDVCLSAVEPRRLTREAIGRGDGHPTVLAIGKAAPGMCWGAHDAVGRVTGICVTTESSPVPPGVELVIGDHPVPRERSFEAGRRVMEMAQRVEGRCIALISGGGSALCEHPREGVDPLYLTRVTETLIGAGVSIDEMNLVRQHLSAIKGGGLAAKVPVQVETYVISDVGGHDAATVASGPTCPVDPDPERVEELLERHGLPIDRRVREAIRAARPMGPVPGPLTVLADGRSAGEAFVLAAAEAGYPSALADRWIAEDVLAELESFLESAQPGVNVTVGEPTLQVAGGGEGGRNTHAALLAAVMLAGSNDIFMAFATDGSDGRSGAAGAIVDGQTLERGGDPSSALARFDSATYLSATSDLLLTGATGTNVADIWALWRT